MGALPRILLASQSAYRKHLLRRIIDDFDVATPKVDESARINESSANLAARLAREKAEALSSEYPNHWIIGSDQVAVRGRTRLEKPGNYAVAHQQLIESAGKRVIFFTSVCLLSPGAEKSRTETDVCRVYFRKLSDDQITGYLQREQPYECAASLKSEGLGIALLEKIEGSDPTALIGLPLILLSRMMADFGLDVLLE
jgi:septum formation protein